MAEVDREAEAFLCHEDRLAARFSDEHLVEREERRAADLALLQEIDALGRDRVVVDDDRLHPRARGRDDRRLVLGLDVGELGHRPMDALDGTGLAALEDRGDRGRVAALHVLRDVGLRLQLRILSGKAQDRGLQLGLLLGEPGLLRPPAMEVLLEFLEALARFLRGRVQFLELPVRVLMLDLVLFPGFLEQGDLGLEAGHRLLGPVSLQDEALDLLLDLVDLVVQRDDLLLDVQHLRVALRREFVDLMEVLVRGLDLAVQLGHAFVDVLPLPREGVRLLLDLPLLLRRVRVLCPELLQRLLRRLDAVRGSSPLDPEAVELVLELLRLLPAAVRHLLLELAQPGHGGVEATAELFLLGRELGLVTFVFCDLLSGPDDLPLDQFAVLVRELGLRRRQALVQVPIFQRAIPVRLELFDLLVDLVEDDSDPIEVLLGLLPLAFRLVDVVVELRDSRDVVEDPAPFHGGHGDDPLDVPLLDEVVPFRRDSRVGEEGVEFGQRGLPVVDVEVRVVAAVDRGAYADIPG